MQNSEQLCLQFCYKYLYFALYDHADYLTGNEKIITCN